MIRSILDRMNLKSRSRRQSSRRRLGQALARLEGLEGRLLLSGATVYTVNLTSATGAGSGDAGDLVYVIGQANSDPNPDGSMIEFDPTVFATPQTITLTSTLVLTETGGPEVIDAPGASLVTISGDNSVGVFSVATGVTASIGGLTITAGSTTTLGFGAGIDNSGALTVSRDILSGNAASGVGGGIANESGGNLTVTQSTFTNNTAIDGGGIDNRGMLVLASDTFDGNSATFFGGGIENEADAIVNDTQSIYTTNMAGYRSGGIDNVGSATLTDDTFSGNTATSAGGGIYNEAGASLTILATTIANNSASYGAGIINTGTAALTDSTIVGNTASVDGGGLFDGSATLSLIACTVSGNVAAEGGGIYSIAPNAVTTLTDTIVAGNTEPAGTPDDINGSDASGVTGSYNLIGTGGSGGINDGQDHNIVLTSLADLGLAPQGDYGGPTETVALLAGSLAIGNGGGLGAVTTDQRGFPLASPVDIGAFQTQPLPLVVNTTVDGVGSPVGDLSLRQALNVANVLVADATITFDPTVFGTPQTITLTGGTLVLSNAQTPETIEGPTGGLTISGNNASGVFQIAGGVTASLSDLTISGGSADFGGGISNQGTLTVSGCTIAQNTATDDGGGIDSSGVLNLVNSTIDGNTAMGQGGGAFLSGGTVTVVNCTIADNVVPGGANAGAGIYLQSGTDVLDNTIVAFNTDTALTSTTPDDIAGTLLSPSSGYNLIGTGGSGGLVNGTNGNLVGVVNPGLGSLANNGGPTDTIALLAGSPAIDAGSNALAVDPNTGLPLAYDQRGPGYPRIVNDVVDIGAFEWSAIVSTPTIYTVDLTTDTGTSTGADSGDLAYVIAQADANPNPAGSVINFDPTVFAPEQTITLTGTLMLSPPAGPIVIDGPDAGVVISGNDSVGLMQIARNATATIAGVTFSDGSAATSGGAIFNNPIADLTLLNDTFTDDTALYDGGAIENNGGTLTIINGSFADNTATDGNGGAIDTSGSLLIETSTFTGGTAVLGGLIDNESGTLRVSNTTFSGGLASSGGGIMNLGDLTITDDIFTGNAAVYYGGAIYNSGGTLAVAGSTFTDNVATYGLGGAIDNSGVATVALSTFTGGAAFQGGAIDNKSGTLSVADSTLESNTGTEGGGIFNNATATITGTTIANDATSFDGGGIANDLAGTMTLVNSTIAFNAAGHAGGGIDQAGGSGIAGSGLTVINSTIAYNTVAAGGSGGGILAAVGTTNLYNTIVALNTLAAATGSTASDISGTVAQTSAYNLIGAGGSGGLTIANGNLIGVTSPGLAAALADNGGPTPTIALLAGSPAIGAGSSSIPGITVPSTDQRGVVRPADSISIGAYQYVPVPVVEPAVLVQAEVSVSAATAPGPANTALSVVPPAESVVSVPTAVSLKTNAPRGGSATKFHKTKKTAALTRPVAVTARHAKASVKHRERSVKKK